MLSVDVSAWDDPGAGQEPRTIPRSLGVPPTLASLISLSISPLDDGKDKAKTETQGEGDNSVRATGLT